MFNTALGSAVANEKGVSSAPSAMNPTAGPGTDGLLTSLVKSQGNSSGQTSPNPNAAEPANAGPTKANSTSTEAPASVTANSPGAVASDSKTQPGVPLPVRNAPHSTAEAINQAQAVVRSEIEQIAIPPSIAPAVPSTPAPAQLETGSLQRTSTNLGPDKSGISSTQDSSGTTRKSSDVTGTTKPQSRKDDASSSFSSPGDDQSPVSVPVRTSDPSAAFSVTGIQPSTSTSSDKSVVPGVPSGSGEPQSGQLDQKSTGVAQTPPQGEAYPTSLVHSAKLVERIGEAELRLGIRAGEFGSVDIRTSMVRNQFTAEISTERGELGRAMAAELPSLQNRLNEQRVPVGNITLQNHAGGQSTASEHQKPREGQPLYATNSGSGVEKSPMPALAAVEAAVPASRLDIHM